MAYNITCQKCDKVTNVNNIDKLISHYIDKMGNLICGYCKSTDTYIYRLSKLQENDETWERFIQIVIPLKTGSQTYHPYIFVASSDIEGKPNQIHFNYYKDTRASGGRLKHGHGPGGAPVLEKKEMLQLLKHLIRIGFIKKNELQRLAE